MSGTTTPSGSLWGAEEFLSSLVASSDDAIVGLAPQGTVASWNSAAEDLFGYRAEEMRGRDTELLCPPDRRGELSGLLERVRNGETVQNVLTEWMRRNGTRVAVSLTLSPVTEPGGALLGMSVRCRDVTGQVHAAASLRRSERSAVEALTLLETLQENAPIGIGFLDREYRIVRLNHMLAALDPSPVRDHIGLLAAEVIPTMWPQVEPLFRRVTETGEAIVNTELYVERSPARGGAAYWLASYYPVLIEGEIVGVGVIALDITARKKVEDAHVSLARAAVGALAATVESRDPHTAGHQNRVAVIAAAVAAELGLERDTIEGVELAARVHDIGKIAIPSEILNYPGRLNAPSWELMKLHASTGAGILRGVEFPWPVAAIVEQHHERLDGSGYPRGLRSDEIELGALIVAVADTVDAMTSHRPYRPAKEVGTALDEIVKGRGRLFDLAVVDACLSLFREGRLALEW